MIADGIASVLSIDHERVVLQLFAPSAIVQEEPVRVPVITTGDTTTVAVATLLSPEEFAQTRE